MLKTKDDHIIQVYDWLQDATGRVWCVRCIHSAEGIAALREIFMDPGGYSYSDDIRMCTSEDIGQMNYEW